MIIQPTLHTRALALPLRARAHNPVEAAQAQADREAGV